MAKASDNPFPSVLLVEQAAQPATPAAGQARLYRGTDNKLYVVDDAGIKAEVGSGGSGGSGGSLLTWKVYNPASNTATAAATVALAAVDATNLTVTFTAPSSGSVIVDQTAMAQRYEGVGGEYMQWGLLDGTTAVVGATAMVGQTNSGKAEVPRITHRSIISGLTPGASYTWKWAHASSSTSAQGKTGYGGIYGPAIMVVRDATIGGGSSSGYVGCVVDRATTQSIGHASWVPIQFNAADVYDTSSIHDPATNNTRFTVPAGMGGVWRFTGGMSMDANSTGVRAVAWNKNGTMLPDRQGAVYRQPSPAYGTAVSTSVELLLAAGDYIEFAVYQESGVALNLTGAHVSCQRLG